MEKRTEKEESREREKEGREKGRKSERGKEINRAIRIVYKRVEDPIQGRPPEKALPRTVLRDENLNDKYITKL